MFGYLALSFSLSQVIEVVGVEAAKILPLLRHKCVLIPIGLLIEGGHGGLSKKWEWRDIGGYRGDRVLFFLCRSLPPSVWDVTDHIWWTCVILAKARLRPGLGYPTSNQSLHASSRIGKYHFPQWFKIWRTYFALGCWDMLWTIANEGTYSAVAVSCHMRTVFGCVNSD